MTITISADSHVTEAANAYLDYCDPSFRDRAPRVSEEEDGVAFIIEGMGAIKIGPAAAAGIPPEDRKKVMKSMADLHRGGWDSAYRLEAQDLDGVSAEVIYPTIGMLVCNHPDFDFKHACFQGYNRWITEYCAIAPDRLLGMGQTAMRSPEEGIKDIQAIKAAGLRGVMMPGVPQVEDYDAPIYDDFWEASIENGIPLSFHILAAGGRAAPNRGPKVNQFQTTIRGVQDIMGMLVFGGVFQRHPKLKLVCAEADAGWTPHFAHRLDRAYTEHRHHMPGQDLEKLPSEYFFEHMYFTFQDDPTAFKFADSMNWKQLLWANDYPHSDATWPNSQALLAEQTKCVTPEQKQAILGENAAKLYNIDLAAITQKIAA